MVEPIIWMGERGAVNEMVIRWKSSWPTAAIDFLRSVKWRSAAPNGLFDGTVVESAVAIVEPSLAQFGTPDLILAVRTRSHRHLFFCEAKRGEYNDEALPNDPGMETEGFNSCINGQLSLRYRFARALQGWDPQKIIEEQWASNPYVDTLRDKIRNRRLADRRARDMVRDHLHDVALDHCYFIALTRDEVPPWSRVSAEYMPLFLTEAAQDRSRARSPGMGAAAASSGNGVREAAVGRCGQ